jgi:SNF2 family DNA or RNA helicase
MRIVLFSFLIATSIGLFAQNKKSVATKGNIEFLYQSFDFGNISGNTGVKRKVGEMEEEEEGGMGARVFSRSGLFSIPWRRVVLDEANKISNRTTKTCTAVLELSALARHVYQPCLGERRRYLAA